jgi:hypothetical protein
VQTSSQPVAASAAPFVPTAHEVVELKSIEEVFAALRSDTGVSTQTFDRYLQHCWKCSKIIKHLHNCPVPFIDLTLEEDKDSVVDTSEPDVEMELVITI